MIFKRFTVKITLFDNIRAFLIQKNGRKFKFHEFWTKNQNILYKRQSVLMRHLWTHFFCSFNNQYFFCERAFLIKILGKALEAVDVGGKSPIFLFTKHDSYTKSYYTILCLLDLFKWWPKIGLFHYDSVSDIGWKIGAQKGYFWCFR